MNYTEYSRPTVGAGGCAYSTLNSYNENYWGRGLAGAPSVSQTRSNEVVIVPSYGGVGYNTLMRNPVPSCNGYYNVRSAYPSYSNGSCGQFSSSLCQ